MRKHKDNNLNYLIMKKFTNYKLGALLMLILVAFTACEKSENVTAPASNQTVLRPTNAITLEHYKTYTNLYKEQRLKDFNAKHPEFPMGDTQKVWFSIDAMKDYIAYVEAISTEKGIPVTGISFHYGVYPKTKEYGIYGGYQTLVMTPTTTINGKNKDFEPLQSTYGNPKPFAEATSNPNIAGKDETTETESSAANRGESIPPEN
jgi:hypothetical protein